MFGRLAISVLQFSLMSSQSQNYFATGGLLPISSSWHQAPQVYFLWGVATELMQA
jgi:hypothetical protein